MIKTKLIKLSYKVKNKIKNKNNNDKSILQKEDPYNRLCKLFKRKKHQNAQYRATTTSPSMAIK